MSDEIIARYTSLADQFGARVEAAPDDAWSKQSPCEGWTATEIVDHVVGSQLGMVRAITGEAPEVDVAADPKGAWKTSYAAMKEALDQPGALDKTAPGPFGEMPIGQIVGRVLTTDALVHTWDLARTVGGDERIDAEAVSQAFSGLKPMDAMIRQPGVFGPKVEPAADADDQERLLNFLGRVTRP